MGVVVKTLAIQQTDDQIVDNCHRAAHRLFGHAPLVFLVSYIPPILILALVTLGLAIMRGLDPFLSKPVLKIDETGISQSGHVWPGENWTLKWEAVTRAQLEKRGCQIEK
jgi:hypothetical protein